MTGHDEQPAWVYDTCNQARARKIRFGYKEKSSTFLDRINIAEIHLDSEQLEHMNVQANTLQNINTKNSSLQIELD
jgi:hypothetical protein